MSKKKRRKAAKMTEATRTEEPQAEGATEVPEPQSEPEPKPEPVSYRAYAVTRKSLGRMRPVFQSFAETGSSDWDADTMERTSWHRLGPDPLFVMWALVRMPDREVVGFMAAQMQPGTQGKEGFVLALHILPAESRSASAALGRALFSWAKALGLNRIVARTRRGDAEGLNEPAAWERFGFRFDSVLMVWEGEDE